MKARIAVIAGDGIGPEVTAEGVRVKVASRPSGAMTAKAEMDDLARVPGGRAEREQVRDRAEDEALRSTSHETRKRD